MLSQNVHVLPEVPIVQLLLHGDMTVSYTGCFLKMCMFFLMMITVSYTGYILEECVFFLRCNIRKATQDKWSQMFNFQRYIKFSSATLYAHSTV